VSAGIRLVLDGATALAVAKGALDQRFPRQREYVSAFFLDVAPARAKPTDTAPTEPAPPAG